MILTAEGNGASSEEIHNLLERCEVSTLTLHSSPSSDSGGASEWRHDLNEVEVRFPRLTEMDRVEVRGVHEGLEVWTVTDEVEGVGSLSDVMGGDWGWDDMIV